MITVVRFAAQVLLWLLVLAVAALAFALSLPLIAFALIVRSVYGLVTGLFALVRTLIRSGEVDGSSDGGEPDALTPQLARRIDGGDHLLPCGCTPASGPTTRCETCGLWSCLAHRDSVHLCDPAEPLYDWSADVDWPVANQLKPTNLDDSAAEPNDLLREIYEHLEQQR